MSAAAAKARVNWRRPVEFATVPVFIRREYSAPLHRAMWVIYLEAGVALLLLLLIVWWTWPRKDKAEHKDE